MFLKTVLFDLDGTLHDSERIGMEANSYAFRSVLKREMTDEEGRFLIGKVAPKVFEKWFPEQANAVWQAVLSRYEEIHHLIEAYPGVHSMLNRLTLAGCKMGVVTSKKNRYALKELQFTGLYPFFAAVVTQEDTIEHKPSPAPLLLAAKQLGVDPKDCVYVGDQHSDIEAAKAAKMISIGALWGDGEVETFLEFKADHIVNTPEEFCALIERISDP